MAIRDNIHVLRVRGLETITMIAGRILVDYSVYYGVSYPRTCNILSLWPFCSWERRFFASSIIIYWPLAVSMPPTKVCVQCKAAVPVRWKQ